MNRGATTNSNLDQTSIDKTEKAGSHWSHNPEAGKDTSDDDGDDKAQIEAT